ncbi:MAG: hypothetical protein R3B97_07400 [Dehalococcoidia bacterium]|nr:hypothetical protein [Dehalococcoidia bacterium]MCA9829111.1 hypothetical protein [Dehalococcoidia bacterium]MCB9485728.1 hypothetical protein [Thermoflexaceae bacterium]
MADTIRIVSPVGQPFVTEASPALRPSSLKGLRPGILENRKANARLLMESMVDGLRERVPLGALTVGSKPVAGPPSPSTFDLLVRNSDFVVVGSSD